MEYKKKEYSNLQLKLNLAVFFTCLPIFIFIIFDLLLYPIVLVAFWLAEIEFPKRKAHIQVIDRAKLSYLTFYEKLGCMYCGYVNGIMAFYKEVANTAEKHWCGILHESKKGFITQEHQVAHKFAKFNDEKEFDEKYTA